MSTMTASDGASAAVEQATPEESRCLEGAAEQEVDDWREKPNRAKSSLRSTHMLQTLTVGLMGA